MLVMAIDATNSQTPVLYHPKASINQPSKELLTAIIPNALLIVHPPSTDLLRFFQPGSRLLAVAIFHHREESGHGPGLKGIGFTRVFVKVGEAEGEFGFEREDESVG